MQQNVYKSERNEVKKNRSIYKYCKRTRMTDKSGEFSDQEKC